jgi:hypothetical protein
VVDRYTKIVLTFIALCVLGIVLRDAPVVRAAFAQTGPVHVIIDGVDPYAGNFLSGSLKVTVVQ